jgi:hypothetical protein
MAVTSPYNAPTGDRRNGAPGQQPGLGGPPPAASGDRLPKPPRRRRPGFAALAVLLIVGAAAAAGLAATRLDERTPYLVAKEKLDVGRQVTRDDLAVARVAADGVTLIPASDVDQVIGKYVQQEIPAGRLLDPGMLGSNGLLKDGYVTVGVPVKAGAVPASGLRSGDHVNLVRSVDGEGTLMVEDAVVSSVKVPTSSGAFSGGGGGETVVSVVLREQRLGRGTLSTQVSAAAVAGQVSFVLLERGTTAGQG